MNVQVDTVQTAAFTMDYCRFGQGREPLVILPGLSVQRVMGSAEGIAEAYRLLAEVFTVYVFERRNELPPAYSPGDMAEDTAAALQCLGLGPVNLFGASQGGMMAMELAIRYPSLVKKLILGSTSARLGQGSLSLFASWRGLAESGDAEALYLSFGEALFPRPFFERSRQLLLDAAKAVTEEDLCRFRILAGGMEGLDLLGDLERIACPVLVLGARDDSVLGGEASLQIAERLGRGTACALHMYGGYGHAAYDLAPDYKERMLRFLTAEMPA